MLETSPKRTSISELMEAARVTGFIEPAERGGWTIETFTVDEGAARLHDFQNPGRGVRPGSYTRLVKGGWTWMSDTPAELRDHADILRKGEGSVLINGLGLGCVVKGLLSKPEVTVITVVENDRDLIELVGPYYTTDKRVTIIEADAFTVQWERGRRFNYVWHDIWRDLCVDNLTEMATLHRRYGRRCDWQGSWGKEWLQYRRQRYGW